MKVITTVEKRNAETPASTDRDSKVSRTLTATFPHRMVVSVRLARFLNFSTRTALLSPAAASISRRSLLMWNTARFKPEKQPTDLCKQLFPAKSLREAPHSSLSFVFHEQAAFKTRRHAKRSGRSVWVDNGRTHSVCQAGRDATSRKSRLRPTNSRGREVFRAGMGCRKRFRARRSPAVVI